MRDWAITLSAMLLAACSGGTDNNTKPAADGADEKQVSLFTSQVEPLLKTSCATCHLTGQEAGAMALVPGKAYAALVDVPSAEMPGLMRVKPGDPDASYLVMKLEGTHLEHGGSGAQMPFGAAPLTPEQIAPIRQWISEGAKQ